MIKYKYEFILLLITSLIINCSEAQNKSMENSLVNLNNILSDEEKKDGWNLLFDGKTTNGWHEFGKGNIEKGWKVENGEMQAYSDEKNKSSDIVTDQQFTNFDFKCDWKISNEGNSGLFYHVLEGEKFHALFSTGPEYQIIDDIGYPGNLEEWQKTGANYAMHNVEVHKILKPVGEWNSSRIVVKDSLVQHYLNDEKILEFKQWTKDWFEKVKNSKWKDEPDYGIHKIGSIGLQSHGNSIWFRNIKIRNL